MRYKEWMLAVESIAKDRDLECLLGDADHKLAWEDGMTPEEYIQEIYEYSCRPE